MRNDVIHRILFDVGCRAEDAVRSIQHTIQHYTLPRVEKATESLFQKFGKDHGHIIIDKVELDLGEFSLTDLEGDCFADAFEYKFAECLEAAGRKYQVGEQAKWNPAKTNWEILKAFLLEGDLPWWINKREALNLRRILMLVLHSEPGQVESFLAQQSDEVARERLWLLLANKDKDRFTYLFKNPDQKRYDFPGLSLMALFSILKEPFHQVMLQEKQAWQKFLQSVNTKYSPRFSKVGEEGQGVTSRESLKRPMSQLQKKMEKMESVSSVKQQSEITRRIEQLLIKKGMFDEAIVKALVKAWKQQQLKRKALVIGLLRKDKFFEFPFLELIMHHPAISEKRVRQGADRLAAAWSRTAKVLARKFRVLTSGEKIQFHTLMNYGVISPRIKKVVKDMLEALPVESLRLIAALADLNEEILQQVMDKNENTQPSSASEKEIIVENGGICLIAAYLPAFFKALGYVDSNRFKTKAHVIRAIYLLHYIVHGKTAAPEYLLQLNKLLCGWRLASPLPHRKRWRKSELLEADELIQSIISNWSALKNTSIEGLRSNFLQRKAILTENEHYWTLKVEKKGVDILLGTINWSYSLVKLPWIKKPLQVEW